MRAHRQTSVSCVKFLLFIVFILCGSLLYAQTLEIALVDGRNGHPMVGKASYVNVWVGDERKAAIAIPTDRNGIARLRLTLDRNEVKIPTLAVSGASIVANDPVFNYEEAFKINVPYALCISEGSRYSWLSLEHFSTKQILQQGYVSPNTCGKTTASPKSGQVLLFVRPLTFLETMKQ